MPGQSTTIAVQSPGTKIGPCTGKKFLVTGGSRGLGKAVVAELYEQGAIIYALARNQTNLNELKEEFPEVATICVDVADWEATRVALEDLEPIDCLINNAAIAQIGYFMDTTKDVLDSIYKTNLRSVLNMSQIVAKKMMENGIKGSIVNVSSIAGRAPITCAAAYSTMKAGLEMLTKIMAIELGPYKIRVNSVCPATLETDMYRDRYEDSKSDWDKEAHAKYMIEKTPTKTQFMPLEEVVDAILFFGANANLQITGESLAIDGGITIAF